MRVHGAVPSPMRLPPPPRSQRCIPSVCVCSRAPPPQRITPEYCVASGIPDYYTRIAQPIDLAVVEVRARPRVGWDPRLRRHSHLSRGRMTALRATHCWLARPSYGPIRASGPSSAPTRARVPSRAVPLAAQDRLTAGSYERPSDFKEDVLLIAHNARSYHAAGVLPRIADRFERFFKAEYVKMQAQLGPVFKRELKARGLG